MDATPQPTAGSLSWRLSSHPITLLTFLGFRICSSGFYTCHLYACPANPSPASVIVYFFGLWVSSSMYVFNARRDGATQRRSDAQSNSRPGS